jgi:uncharacterized protein YggE
VPGAAPATIEVEAEGEVLARPDVAILMLTVETEAPQAQEAAGANAKVTEALLPALKKLLSPQEKLQTLSVRVYPLYRMQEKTQEKRKIRTQEVYAYRATHSFRVELKDLAKIGQVFDAGLKHGATQVRGPYWDHSQKEQLQQQAAVLAFERARDLAAALAKAAGRQIKGVKKVSTLHALRPYPKEASLRMAAAPLAEREPETTVEVGEEKFQAKISAIFELAP